MAASDLIRWGGLAAMASGVLLIVYSLLGFAVGKGDEPSPLDILAIVAYVLQVVGLVGFHTLQGRNYGRIGRAGLYTTIGSIVIWEFLILTSLLLELAPQLLYEGGVLLLYPLRVCIFSVNEGPQIGVLTNVEHMQLRVSILRELHRRLRCMGSAL